MTFILPKVIPYGRASIEDLADSYNALLDFVRRQPTVEVRVVDQPALSFPIDLLVRTPAPLFVNCTARRLGDETATAAVSAIEWHQQPPSESGGQVRVLGLSGLTAELDYRLSFLIVGGQIDG